MFNEFQRAMELSEKFNSIRILYHRMRFATALPESLFGILAVTDIHHKRTGEERIRLGKICHMLQRPMPSVTRSANTLEEEGYIVKSACQADRRAVFIALTPKGRQVLEDSLRARFTMLENVLDRLGEQDTAQVFRVLDKLSDILDEIKEEKIDD